MRMDNFYNNSLFKSIVLYTLPDNSQRIIICFSRREGGREGRMEKGLLGEGDKKGGMENRLLDGVSIDR